MTDEELRKKQIEEASGTTYTGTPTPIAPSPEPFDTGDASPDWWMNTAATKQTASSPTTAEPSTAVQEQMGDVMTTAGMMVPGMTAAPPPPTGDIVGTGTGWPPPNDGIFLQGDPNANGGYIPLQPGQPPAPNFGESNEDYQKRVEAFYAEQGRTPYRGGTQPLPEGAQREMPIRRPGESVDDYHARLAQWYDARGMTDEAAGATAKAEGGRAATSAIAGIDPNAGWDDLWGDWRSIYGGLRDELGGGYQDLNRLNRAVGTPMEGGDARPDVVREYEDRILGLSRDASAGLTREQVNALANAGLSPGSPGYHQAVLRMAGVEMPSLEQMMRDRLAGTRNSGEITWADGTTVDAPSGGNTVLPPWMSDGTGIPGGGGGGGGTGGGTGGGGGGTRSPNPYRNEWMTSDNLANWSRNWMDNPSRYDADVVRQGMEVIEQALGRVRDEGMAGMDEYMAGRGLVGSSVEAGERGLLEDRVQRAASERAFALLQDQARTFGDDRSRAFGANLASADFLSGLHRNRERLDQQDFANRMAQSGLDLGTIDTILRGIATVDPEVLSGYLTPEQIRALLGGGR